METAVRNFTDKQLLDKVKMLSSFKGIPYNYWLIGVISDEDTYNTFDDKIYLFHGETFISVMTGTTNAGADGLLNWKRYNKLGCLVWKTNEIYYDLWSSLNWDRKTKFKHKGKMKALRQDKAIKIFRDNNLNKKAEQIGTMYTGHYGCNFHLNTYETKPSLWNKFKKWLIGGWSLGCVVSNDPEKYYNEFMSRLYNQDYVTYAIITEK